MINSKFKLVHSQIVPVPKPKYDGQAQDLWELLPTLVNFDKTYLISFQSTVLMPEIHAKLKESLSSSKQNEETNYKIVILL